MDSNLFFKKNKFKVKKLFPNVKINKDFIVDSVKPLHLAKKQDITFLTLLNTSKTHYQQREVYALQLKN